RGRRVARLVERERPRRPGARRGHAWRALRAHDRDAVRARAPRAHEREGDAGPAAAGALRAGVQRRARAAPAAARRAAGDLRRARPDCTPARLPRDLPSALADGPRPAGVTRLTPRRAAGRAGTRAAASGAGRSGAGARWPGTARAARTPCMPP